MALSAQGRSRFWRILSGSLALALALANPAPGLAVPKGEAVFGFDGVLLGGFSQGRWVSAADVQSNFSLRRLRVWGGHEWRLFSFSGPQGTGIVSAIHQEHPEEYAKVLKTRPFGQARNLTFDIHLPGGPLGPGSALLAVDCVWNPKPRPAQPLPASDAESRSIVHAWLKARGLEAEDPAVVQSFLCDLDGDGEFERIVSAQNVLGPEAGLDWRPDRPFAAPAADLRPRAERGRFSVLIVRQGTGRVDVLHDYVAGAGGAKCAFFKVQQFADLDGDGTMEVVAANACAEGLGYELFARRNGRLERVLASGEAASGRADAGPGAAEREQGGAAGTQTPPGDAEAVQAFRLAEAGDAARANAIGTWYEKGKHGLPRDGREAFAWYSKAARLGSALALHNMGDCYRDGIGVARDREKELECYLACAAKGLAIGYEDVGDSLLRKAPAGLAIDAGKAALRWYVKAAAHGRKGAADKLRRLGGRAPSPGASPLPVCRGRLSLATAECGPRDSKRIVP